VDPADVHLDDQSERSIEGEGELTARRNVEILQEYSERRPAGKRKRVVLRFLRSPVRILGEDRVEGIELVRNELHHGGDGGLRAQSTEEHETLEAGLVFRSIGYRGVPIEGVPFDEWRGTVPNEGGRVLDPHEQTSVAGEYVVGWIKRGPSGVIGTNKRDAQETVNNLIEDLHEGRLPEPTGDPSAEAIGALLAERKPEHVTYRGWELIDAVEVGAGEPLGRPRVKLTKVDEMLDAATGAPARS